MLLSKKTGFILVLSFLLIALIYQWGWLADPARGILRYQPTGINPQVSDLSAPSFAESIAGTPAAIENARRQAQVDASRMTVLENSPQEWLPDAARCNKEASGKYHNGILLIHGLLVSPYVMNALANYFHDQCFVVDAMLLPGHGTAAGDLLTVSDQDWRDAVDFAATHLSGSVDHFYMAGFSLGGLLAIDQALKGPANLKAVILFAPMMGFKSKLTFMLSPLQGLSHIVPRLRWWERHADAASNKYESLPLNAVYQVKSLLKKVQSQLFAQELSVPVFIVQSEEDSTVSAADVLNFFGRYHQPASRLLWFTAGHSIPMVQDTRIQLIDSSLPSQKILSLSHLSLLLPSSDPVYGDHGRYRDCLGYPEGSANWVQCKAGNDTYQGETTQGNLKSHVIQRLTYNPFYGQMLEQLTLFLRQFSGN
jgi:esterase/lipase